jgi:hypothetical protein
MRRGRREKETRIMFVEKYYLFRHSLSKRLFNCIIEWGSSLGGYVDFLELLVSKK